MRRVRLRVYIAQDEADQISALGVFIVILRFMGDLPEPPIAQNGKATATNGADKPGAAAAARSGRDSVPIMSRIYGSIGRKASKQEVKLMEIAAEQMVR